MQHRPRLGLQADALNDGLQLALPVLEQLAILGEQLVLTGTSQLDREFAELLGARALVRNENGVGVGRLDGAVDLQRLLDDRVEDDDIDLFLRISLVVVIHRLMQQESQFLLIDNFVVESLTLGLPVEELIGVIVGREGRLLDPEGVRCNPAHLGIEFLVLTRIGVAVQDCSADLVDPEDRDVLHGLVVVIRHF